MPDDFVLDLGRLQQYYDYSEEDEKRNEWTADEKRDEWAEDEKRDKWTEEMEEEWDNSIRFQYQFLIICLHILDLVKFVVIYLSICLFVLFLRAG